ncbi:MAG TPA: FAD-dependent oxidoreductase [Candidatus Binataceae bacterium]|nr:FAD-dependent oxidoreductase [Candidatus Binataceae bacterium]
MARVAIVGAGPAGAALAYLLARRGLAVTLLERQTDFAREFRGEGLMPSGAEVFHQMGLGAALDALPQARLERFEVFLNARSVGALALATDGPGAFSARIVSQPAMLEMLVGEAARFPGFRLERGATVRDVVREGGDGGRVAGVLADGAHGTLEVRADLVVGCDGRNSVLRRRTALEELRYPQAFDVIWAKLPMPAALAGVPAGRLYVGRGHFALMFPSYDGRLQIGWIIDKGLFGDLRKRGVEAWLLEMAAHLSADLAAHLCAHLENVTHPFLLDVACERIMRWSVPGMLLLGDAAHTMSPVGAQGINLALRDAAVAANHLCEAVEAGGQEPGALAERLDTAGRAIEAERTPEIVTIQEMQQRPPRVLLGRSIFGRLLLTRLGLRIVGGALGRTMTRRFATGVSPVRLRV